MQCDVISLTPSDSQQWSDGLSVTISRAFKAVVHLYVVTSDINQFVTLHEVILAGVLVDIFSGSWRG